jgi:hypothetical protein
MAASNRLWCLYAVSGGEFIELDRLLTLSSLPRKPRVSNALVVKELAYDFLRQDTQTETAQCLERTEAANDTFYFRVQDAY